jgi:hypothetical protein
VSGLTAWDRGRLPVVPRWIATIAVVVVLLAAGAFAITQLASSSATRHTSKRSSSAGAGRTQFRDPAGAFAGSYPSSWQRLSSSDPQVVLLASGPGGASYLVRKTPLAVAVTNANLLAAKQLTERVVRSGKDVKFLRLTGNRSQPEVLSLGGLPGFLYLYTFVDPTTGQTGAHAHYFLFDGKTMITLVFQSLPSNNFTALAPLFDRIVNTFHVLPG